MHDVSIVKVPQRLNGLPDDMGNQWLTNAERMNAEKIRARA